MQKGNTGKKRIWTALSLAGVLMVSSANVMAAEQDVIYYSEYDFITKEETLGKYTSEDYTNDASRGISQGFEGTIESESKSRTNSGWFTKNGHRYYRMPNGKLCTKEIAKIGKNYYSFDSKGRMQTGLIAFSDSDMAYFSKTYGNLTNYVKELVVVKKYSGSVTAKDADGKLYIVNLKKVVDKGQNAIPASRIKKNSVIHVIYRGGIQETHPAQFDNAYKVRLMK